MATPLQTTEHNLGARGVPMGMLDVSPEALQVAVGLSRALQTSLDPARLVDLFSDQLQALVAHDGLLYSNTSLQLKHKTGSQSRHRCTYTLNIGDEPLGELVLCRRSKFSEEEAAQIEDHLCYLLYPLRNALLYQDALNLAQKDPLTGIYNRAALDEALQREIRHAQRQNNPLSLVVLDIDHFKAINDQYGHIIGDCVLKAVVKNIQSCMRNTDQLFRYGGEEFVVLMRDTDGKGACLLAERIRSRIETAHCLCSGAEIPVTTSAGVSSLREHDSPVALFAHADQALYLAKEGGRNQVRCASQED